MSDTSLKNLSYVFNSNLITVKAIAYELQQFQGFSEYRLCHPERDDYFHQC